MTVKRYIYRDGSLRVVKEYISIIAKLMYGDISMVS